ncbi:transposase for insertion sequence element [Mycobacterium tuberculosis KT-0008]|nr:transposase for insertion sequence element [Mycobacterium tuberculosis KT-0008]
MTSSHLIDAEQLLADQLAQASPDLLRGLLSTFIAALMGAEADALCGAGYRERSDERSNQRNGYCHPKDHARNLHSYTTSLALAATG